MIGTLSYFQVISREQQHWFSVGNAMLSMKLMIIHVILTVVNTCVKLTPGPILLIWIDFAMDK